MKTQTVLDIIFDKFNTLSDADFKSWMLNNYDELKEIEKKQITDCCVHTTQSCWTSLMDEIGKPLVFTDEDLKNQNLEAEQYYSQTFGGGNDN